MAKAKSTQIVKINQGNIKSIITIPSQCHRSKAKSTYRHLANHLVLSIVTPSQSSCLVLDLVLSIVAIYRPSCQLLLSFDRFVLSIVATDHYLAPSRLYHLVNNLIRPSCIMLVDCLVCYC
jgi:hypothetical protein